MIFKLKKFNSIDVSSILKSLTIIEREKSFIKEIVKKCKKDDVVIYILYYDELICGFIAMSVNKIDEIPTIEIEYIFVKDEFRKYSYKNLSNLKISEYLIFEAIKISFEIKEKIGIRWLSLVPDNEVLEKYYIEKLNFIKYKSKKNNKIYLFIALKKN